MLKQRGWELRHALVWLLALMPLPYIALAPCQVRDRDRDRNFEKPHLLLVLLFRVTLHAKLLRLLGLLIILLLLLLLKLVITLQSTQPTAWSRGLD